MTKQQLIQQIQDKNSYLCVGLDTDISKIPQHLLTDPDPVFTFNKSIIDATHDLCVSYKINTAFYEALGVQGWEAMEKTARYIGSDHFIIADAKRGDIGNTSNQYAKAFFEALPFDAVTVAPYMGKDSVSPFLQHEGKWAIVLGLTSNKGAKDFELQMMVGGDNAVVRGDTNHGDKMVGEDTNHDGEKLYEKVLRTVAEWASTDNLMFVVGATQADEFVHVRKIVPNHFLLVPGVGAQGGSLQEISEKAMNKDIGLLVNVSRAIIYAGSTENFATAAREAAQQYQEEMKQYLKNM